MSRAKNSGIVCYITSDASDLSGQKKAAERLKQDFGRLDVIFVNRAWPN
jgi:hypothetical protein